MASHNQIARSTPGTAEASWPKVSKKMSLPVTGATKELRTNE